MFRAGTFSVPGELGSLASTAPAASELQQEPQEPARLAVQESHCVCNSAVFGVFLGVFGGRLSSCAELRAQHFVALRWVSWQLPISSAVPCRNVSSDCSKKEACTSLYPFMTP